MKLAIGCDHGGFLLKQEVVSYLKEKGYDVIDCGCDSLDSVDYPVYAKKVSNYVSNNEVTFGILICTTGIGMSICANKFKGVRAALVSNEDCCMMTRMHNNSNVLCMGAKYTTKEQAFKYCDIFLNTNFEGGRHLRRVEQIEER